MPKLKQSHASLVKEWLSKVPNSTHFRADGDQIFCQPCCKGYRFRQYSDVIQHVKAQSHILNFSKFTQQQPLFSDIDVPNKEFNEDLSEAFVASGIPWFRLQNPVLRKFLEKYTQKKIPDESTLRKNYLKTLHTKSVQSIQNEVGNHPIWIAVDATTDVDGRYIVNVLIGAMRKDQPSKAHLIMFRQLQATNNSTITQSVIESISILWPGITPSGIDKKFLLLLTDGVNYMRKAGKNLKAIYPKLRHVTCLAHGINRVAEDVRSHFPEVDKLVGNMKAVFRKSPSRVAKFKEMFPALTLPPKPVLTRWGTWLDAV